MTMKIAVAGATGRVGRHVVDVLEERGREVVAISRAQGVDVITGDGLAEALADLATDTSPIAPDEPFTEIAGPREENLAEMARLLVARRGESLRIEEGGNPADPDSEVLSSGALLPGPEAKLAGPTFQ